MTTTPTTQADIPAKVQRCIQRALEGGLTVTETDVHGDMRSWTIASPNPIDDTQLWLYFYPGRNGGSLRITKWRGHVAGRRKNAVRVTRKEAAWELSDMADSLKRHQERTAKRVSELAAELADKHTADEIQAQIDQSTDEEKTRLPYQAYREALRLIAAREALAMVGAQLDGAVVPALADCGCPLNLITDAGHQEGCAVGDEESDRAERFQLTVAQLRAAIDPTRPGWFLVDQNITDRASGHHFRVAVVENGPDGNVARVAVTLDGGYGNKLHWYGDHPEAVAGLDTLEGDHIGTDDLERRPWPRSGRVARNVISYVIGDQRLSGWADDRPDGSVVVNVPDGVDPTRHLILLERYIPYHAVVRLSERVAGRRNRYPTILITPKEV